MWLAIASAVLLGIYDIVKKDAAVANAVPVVLWLSSLVGAALWLTVFAMQWLIPDRMSESVLHVPRLSGIDHVRLAAKSLLVGCSWTASLYALKHLPLSIASPIRSTSPVISIICAIAFLQERPSPLQCLGMAIVAIAFWFFSIVGRTEGIHFRRNRWVGWMIMATVLGALSSIYDKILLQSMGYSVATVQSMFTLYMVPVMTPLALHWWWRRRSNQSETPFRNRLSIWWISPLLLAADWVYFTALANPEAMVSVVSTLRRCSVIVVLALGAKRLGEVNLKRKTACVFGLLSGVVLVLLG
ncbi:MAG: DMT family transporter [Planctomycetota bacterium]